MSWIKCTEAMPPAGSKVKLKWADGTTEWENDIIAELEKTSPRYYHMLLWWLESPSTDVSGLKEALEKIALGTQGMDAENDFSRYAVEKAKKALAQYSTLPAPADEIEGSISEREDDKILADVEKIRKESGVYIWAFPITYRDENGKVEKITFGWEIEWPSGQTNGYNQECETYFKALNEGIKAYQ